MMKAHLAEARDYTTLERQPGGGLRLMVRERGYSLGCRAIQMTRREDDRAPIVTLLKGLAAEFDMLCDEATIYVDREGASVAVVPNPLYDLSGMD